MNIYENRVFQVCNDEYGIDYGAISTLGVYFITDKQSAFESRMWTEENNYLKNGPTHPGIIDSIDKKVYDDDDRNKDTVRRNYNAYIYLYKDSMGKSGFNFLISLPENGILSQSQSIFLEKALDDLEQYIQYAGLSDDGKYVSISILASDNENDGLHISETREKIRKHTVGYQKPHKEKIIGKTLNNDEIEAIIRQTVNFNKCKNLNDLLMMMEICNNYYQDDYYHDLFIKVFPNYLEVSNLVNEIGKMNVGDIHFDQLTFDNIYEILNGTYDNYKVPTNGIKR